MAQVVKERVRETTTTTGTGTVTLAGAVSQFQAFSVIGNGNTTYYSIVSQSANEWEVGIGTYTLSGTTLSRTTVIASSNAGALVNFSAGTKDVFCTLPAAYSRPAQIPLACSDETTALTVGTAKVTLRNYHGATFNITNVRLSATTAPTGAALIADIKVGGSTIFSTKIQIDAAAKTSVGSGTPYVLSTTTIADDAEITVDITQIGSTVAGAGLKAYLVGFLT